MSQLRLALLVCCLSFFAGCASSGGADSCAGIGKSAAPSAACCLSYGADACGANLFCAAFDGRTQATCYGERTRLDNTECSADIQCLSGSCATDVKKCRMTLGAACDATLGCGFSPTNVQAVCALVGGKMMCAVPNAATGGNVCAADADCGASKCNLALHNCLKSDGSSCAADTDCASGHCTNSKCAKGTGATCTQSSECASNECSNGKCFCVIGGDCLTHGAACTSSWSCASGHCADPGNGMQCLGVTGDPCVAGSMCASAVCNGSVCF